jgi:hypothetical protein
MLDLEEFLMLRDYIIQRRIGHERDGQKNSHLAKAISCHWK